MHLILINGLNLFATCLDQSNGTLQRKTDRKLKTANEKVRVPHTNQIEVPAAKAQQVRRSK